MLLEHLETAFVVLCRLLYLTPLILHTLDGARQPLGLLVHPGNLLLPFDLYLLLLFDLHLELPAHAILLLEHLFELLSLKARSSDLHVGSRDLRCQFILPGRCLCELGVEPGLQILQGSGLGVLLADQVLKAEMDGEAREARHRLQRRWLIRGQRQSGVGEKVVREEIVEGR